MFKKWINQPKAYEEDNKTIMIEADKSTDFFVDPLSNYFVHNAPIYTFEVKGDFTFECKLTPDFSAFYDAGAIMYYIDDKTWIKFAFEMTDLGHTSVVSVVTNGVSDDANGERIEDKSIWLKLSKKDNVVGLHYSSDSIKWKMVRLFKYDAINKEKAYIGVEAQSPAGAGCSVEFSDIKFTNDSARDFRKGI